MSEHTITLDEDNFDEQVLKSESPVLVDYWAEWCGPCKLIGPILEEIAQDYAGRLIVGKVNVDENQSIAQTYGIRGIPTLTLFKDGEQVASKMGALSKSQLAAFLDQNL